MTLLIQAANIEYAYGGNDVLTGATFEIRQGDRLALIGANGSGKSTLFRLMAGQLRPQRGHSRWRAVPGSDSSVRSPISIPIRRYAS